MFDTLLASGLTRDEPVGARLLAAGIHIGLITAAVLGTTRATAHAPEVDPIIAVWVPRLPPQRTVEPVPAEDLPSAPGLPSDPGVELPDIAIPLSLPSETTGDALSPAGAAKRHDGAIGDSLAPERGPAPFLLVAEVDQPVAVLEPGVPRYPPRLQTLGISGRVVLEFVVDTTGAVEANSLRVRVSTEPGFEDAARAAILATRFRPAQVRGRPVRQLASQAIVFRVR